MGNVEDLENLGAEKIANNVSIRAWTRRPHTRVVVGSTLKLGFVSSVAHEWLRVAQKTIHDQHRLFLVSGKPQINGD